MVQGTVEYTEVQDLSKSILVRLKSAGVVKNWSFDPINTVCYDDGHAEMEVDEGNSAPRFNPRIVASGAF
jgi:hypothetical protein